MVTKEDHREIEQVLNNALSKFLEQKGFNKEQVAYEKYLSLFFEDLEHLTRNVNGLVQTFGVKGSNLILYTLIKNVKIPVADDHRLKLITDYIISQCISLFDLDATQFNSCTIREYREARMACYHLLKKYTGSSYARIGQRFGWKFHTIFYFCQKCDEILSLPQFYKSFTDKYNSLEGSTINFISQLK